MTKRTYVEITPNLKVDLKLLCFLKGIKEKDFASDAIKHKLEPFLPWLESIRTVDEYTE